MKKMQRKWVERTSWEEEWVNSVVKKRMKLKRVGFEYYSNRRVKKERDKGWNDGVLSGNGKRPAINREREIWVLTFACECVYGYPAESGDPN